MFDALLSKRPYKDAWSLTQALKEIRAQSGRHFDPQVVEAFLTLVPRLEEDLIGMMPPATPPRGALSRRPADGGPPPGSRTGPSGEPVPRLRPAGADA